MQTSNLQLTIVAVVTCTATIMFLSWLDLLKTNKKPSPVRTKMKNYDNVVPFKLRVVK